MTIQLKATIVVARPLADVALYLVRPEYEKDYWPGVTSVRLVGGSPGRVGVRYERSFESLGRTQRATVTLLEHQPGRRVVFESVHDVMTVRTMIRFSSTQGGTQVDYEMNVDTKWFLAFSHGRIRKNMQDNLSRALENAKGRLEARRPAPVVVRATPAPPPARTTPAAPVRASPPALARAPPLRR